MLLEEPACPGPGPVMTDSPRDSEDDLEFPDLDSETPVTPRDSNSGHGSSGGASPKRSRSKKRVQFLPDGILVRIREISPRSNKSSVSDCSGSESSSDSEESDTDTSDSEDTSERDTPSPGTQTQSKTEFTTMPPLVWNQHQTQETPTSGTITIIPPKQSYKLNTKAPKTGATVARITGIHRPTSPSNIPKAATVKRARRTPSPRLDKRPKKPVKPAEKNSSGGGHKHNFADTKKHKPQKKPPPLKKDGKSSPPPPNVKQLKSNPPMSKSAMSKPTLAQRRINSAPSSHHKFPPSKRNVATTVSLTALPLTSPQALSPSEVSVDRVGRAMQCLNMGKLYTVDGFIFPSHQATDNLHLPELSEVSKSLDDSVWASSRRGSTEEHHTGFPQRYHSGASSANGVHGNQSQQLSPSSANRRRRLHAWQMANGNTSRNGLSISQMWESVSPASTPRGGSKGSHHNGFTN